MPRTISALRSARVAEVKHQRNRSIKTAVKTYIGTAEAAIASGDNEKARQAVKEAIIQVDLAVKRGVMHDNTGARRKSVLMKKLNKALPGYTYIPLVVDGVYGCKTRIAVLMYFESRGWNQDGEKTGWTAGDGTRTALAKL